MDYMALGQRIRYLREKKHLTQDNVAESTKISTSFYGHIERGSRIASLETLMRIASVLGVTPDHLLLGLEQEQYQIDRKRALRLVMEMMQEIIDSDQL